MGTNCIVDSTEPTSEVTIGNREYGFKKKIVPKNDKDNMFYGKSSIYDNKIKGQIHSATTMGRNVENFNNGNVNVIIPCPSAANENYFS